MKNIESFKEFQNLFSSTKLEIGIVNIPISEDPLVEILNEIWPNITNEKGYSDKSSFTFIDFMRLMKENHRVYEYRQLSN